MSNADSIVSGTTGEARVGAPRASRWTSTLDSAALGRLAAQVRAAASDRPDLVVHAPFTAEPIGVVPHCTAEDVAAAVVRARAAQLAWKQTSFAQRRRIFLRFHDLVLERQEFLLDLLQLEAGKARRDAFDEIADLANVTRYYARSARRHLRPRQRAGIIPLLTRTREYRHPIGVVGILAPWNYPLTIPISDAVPALLAGNAVVLKPSELTPFIALAALELLLEAGLPDGLLQAVTAPGPEIGGALIDHVDYLAFTGSSETGRIVAARAGARLIGFSLELGGKNCMIVLEDAHLGTAVRGAVRNAFASAGQLCMSAERIYVHAALYDRFVAEFMEQIGKLRLGASFDYSADIGCLAGEDQVRKVERHLDDALAKGATLLAGGRRRPELGPYFFEPTVLTNVTDAMDVAAEETFGPVVAVYRFADAAEAVAHANATPFGLNASVWTRRPRVGRELATRLEVGTASINDSFTASWGSVDAPLGGFKASGMGRRHGAEGIRRFTEAQTVAIQHGAPLAPPPGMSEARFARLLELYMKLRRRLPGGG
jgi:succinate-semialdehyde dehydrogenase / glutarate-semialdehyde dehydrogenase